jgi:hypothetical protein
MKVVLLLSVLALGCGSSGGVDCSTLGAPAAPSITVTFATATAATFAVDGNARPAICDDAGHGTVCVAWTIVLDLALGTHTLAVSVPGQAVRDETFVLAEVKNGCGEEAAQPDQFSL